MYSFIMGIISHIKPFDKILHFTGSYSGRFRTRAIVWSAAGGHIELGFGYYQVCTTSSLNPAPRDHGSSDPDVHIRQHLWR